MPKYIKDKSIDMIICDLPYGTTKNKWDSIIDIDRLWLEYKRIIKDNGAIVLFAQTPFDKILGASNLKMLRYEWIWEKTQATGHLNAKRMPMKAHENILVFYKKLPTYNPQKTKGHKPMNSGVRRASLKNYNYNETSSGFEIKGCHFFPCFDMAIISLCRRLSCPCPFQVACRHFLFRVFLYGRHFLFAVGQVFPGPSRPLHLQPCGVGWYREMKTVPGQALCRFRQRPLSCFWIQSPFLFSETASHDLCLF